MATPKTSWRDFEHNEITHSGAHYLMSVSAFMKAGFEPKAADLARQLGVSRAAVSAQLKSLVEHRLLAVNAARRIQLTRSGADLVARIAGKREVMNAFLRDILGVPEQVARLDSCKIEHLISEETGAALVHLTQFIGAGGAEVKAFLKAFHRSIKPCGSQLRCGICAGECVVHAREKNR